MTQLDIFAPQGQTETSREAAASIDPQGDALRVLRLVIETPGLTCDGIEEKTGLRHQTASARVNGLRNAGYIVTRLDADGKPLTAPTRSGRKAQRWYATDKGMA